MLSGQFVLDLKQLRKQECQIGPLRSCQGWIRALCLDLRPALPTAPGLVLGGVTRPTSEGQAGPARERRRAGGCWVWAVPTEGERAEPLGDSPCSLGHGNPGGVVMPLDSRPVKSRAGK